MKLIPLTREHFTMVDDEDYEYLNKFNWQLKINGRSKYAIGHPFGGYKKDPVLLHRYLLNITDPKIFIDHKDHDGLNNQKLNLRTCSPRENSFNARPSLNALSKFKGVY